MTWARTKKVPERKRFIHISKRYVPSFDDGGNQQLTATESKTYHVGATQRKIDVWNTAVAKSLLRRKVKQENRK